MKLFLLLLSIPALAWAGELRLGLEEAPDYALRHNLALAAARVRIAEARGRLLGAGRLTNPELEVEFSQNIRRPERMLGVAFTQRFPVTARLRLEKAVSRAQLAAAEAEVRDVERRLNAEVRTVAVKLLALQAQRELRQQQLATNQEQTAFVAKRVAIGEAAASDAALGELESAQLAVELLQMDASRAALIGELRPLLGTRDSVDVEISGSLATPGAVPERGAPAGNRPDLAAARHTAEAARQSAGLAKTQKWQDIGAGLTSGAQRTEDAPEGLQDDYFLGLQLSVPLPLWNKNQGPIAQATAAATRAQREVESLVLGIQAEAEAARAEMAALSQVVAEMDRGLLPNATQVEDQLRTSYGAGQTPLTEVLRARARRLELSGRRLNAVRDFHLARVRYEAAVGQNSYRSPQEK